MKRIFLGIDLPNDLKLEIDCLKLNYRLNQLPIKPVEQKKFHVAIKLLNDLL